MLRGYRSADDIFRGKKESRTAGGLNRNTNLEMTARRSPPSGLVAPPPPTPGACSAGTAADLADDDAPSSLRGRKSKRDANPGDNTSRAPAAIMAPARSDAPPAARATPRIRLA